MRDPETDKPRFDLLVPDAVPFDEQFLTRIAAWMARGVLHYEDRNWEKFSTDEERRRAVSSAFRHFMQWMSGVDDGEDHASAVFFNIMTADYIRGRIDQKW